uniref:ATP synthase subunit a n=1 Tax=Eiseniibacteriota bacterium TaxID=2212470 RepID=A0A832I718_UNCEI
MGLEFLARVRRTTLWVGALAAIVGMTYSGFAAGGGLAAGAVWSLVNLFLVERLVVALTGSDRGTPAAARGAALALAGMLGLFAAGAFLLMALPAEPLLVGFGFPFGVMLLKACSTLLLESAAWRRFTASRWQVALAVALLIAATWAIAERSVAASGGAVAAGPSGAAHGDAAHADAAHGDAGEHGASSKPTMFPNFLGVVIEANHGKPWADALHHVEPVVFSLFVALLLSGIAIAANRRRALRPGRFQAGVELVVQGLFDFVASVLGEKHARRYLPFLGSLFLYILAMNWIGFVPGFHAATANINITAGLALCTFLFVQFTGMRELGFGGWVDHMAGSPRSAIEWGLVPIMLPIHIIGELAKPLSLACRLFGNIFGEDMLLVGFASLGIMMLGFIPNVPVGIPLQLPFLFFCLLTSTLQALVFTTLSTVYLLLMLPHDDHGHEGEAHPAH